MPKVIGIVGYKNSGKTTLTRKLAQALKRRGYTVAVVKHTAHHALDLPGKDTAVLGAVAEQVAIIAAEESALFWPRPLGLEEAIAHLQTDFVLVEGFKRVKTHPKIVCLGKEPGADLGGPAADLFDEQAILAVGPPDQAVTLDVPYLDWNDVEQITDLVEQFV
ncbi:MAG TPA: molybdopterin-guanine dinucleotide biosynthesis protein B [Chloroflexi bacterium]|nr:molybdopterin-guanine dinucleotide biosynthesis protein B [Chloroflexota bacterium]